MARYIDADKLIEGRVENDPVVIAANGEPTADDETKEILKDKFERKLIEAICLHADDMKTDINALKKFGVEISKEGISHDKV